VHDGDLPGRAAEVDETELQPEEEGLFEWDGRRAQRSPLVGIGSPGSMLRDSSKLSITS